jgi:hypothetical protein
MTETDHGMARFYNWMRWACGGECRMIMKHYYPERAAVAGNYLPEAGEVWNDETPIPIDVKDALEVERLITRELPIHLSKAVRFYFVGRPQIINIPDKVIKDWVYQAARQIMYRKFRVVEK